MQDLSQDLENGCPKLAIVLGVLFPREATLQFSDKTMNICLLNEIKHYVHVQCHLNYIEMKRNSFNA